MLQRGRVGKLRRAMLPMMHQQQKGASIHKLPPPPPKYLDAPEREAWNAIMHEHDGLNRGGELLLENALQAMGRARTLRAIIDRDGVLLTGREGLPRKHPLLAIEAQLRKLVQTTFKALKIELRGELFDQFHR
jgi:hypothetical protein